ncbi:MAG: DUF4390 domain-containing protein [Thermodesulfovibrio sp.]|nr:DUF4390 domain-containing protein [Thermodesulfovibrio sp.]MDW7998891.1 DUF4390 domain-containing protein [Thermodesulfovibrio sp.]
MKKFEIKLLFVLVFVFFHVFCVYAIENINMEVYRESNFLTVKTQIIPSQDFIEDFKSGLSKNILILIELYRKWAIIPDEFITGVQIQRILIPDPIKDEFIIRTLEGDRLTERRFKNWQEALDWTLKIDPLRLVNINSVDRGRYYIKITVESNIKKLPTILEHILFFLPTHERKITKESDHFRLP